MWLFQAAPAEHNLQQHYLVELQSLVFPVTQLGDGDFERARLREVSPGL